MLSNVYYWELVAAERKGASPNLSLEGDVNKRASW